MKILQHLMTLGACFLLTGSAAAQSAEQVYQANENQLAAEREAAADYRNHPEKAAADLRGMIAQIESARTTPGRLAGIKSAVWLRGLLTRYMLPVEPDAELRTALKAARKDKATTDAAFDALYQCRDLDILPELCDRLTATIAKLPNAEQLGKATELTNRIAIMGQQAALPTLRAALNTAKAKPLRADLIKAVGDIGGDDAIELLADVAKTPKLDKATRELIETTTGRIESDKFRIRNR